MKHKLVIKLMIFVLVLACVGPFLIRDKEGKPLMTVDKIKWPNIKVPKLSKLLKSSPKQKKEVEYTPVETEILSPNITEPTSDQEIVKIYTYKDENGISHYTNKEPDRGDYKVIYMPVSKGDEKNALSRLKEKIKNFTQNIKQDKPSYPTTPTSSTQKEPSEFSISDIYTQPSKAINDAKELKEQVEAKLKEREKMMED